MFIAHGTWGAQGPASFAAGSASRFGDRGAKRHLLRAELGDAEMWLRVGRRDWRATFLWPSCRVCRRMVCHEMQEKTRWAVNSSSSRT
jgi:hypothetical protein